MNAKAKRAGALLASLCVAAGLLLWFKLRLVTGIPRTAIANPERDAGARPDPEPADKPATDPED